jgi:hypothetical protein
MAQKQEVMESQIEGTQQTVNDQLSAIQHSIVEDKAVLTKRIDAVCGQFETLRFEVDRIASTKADVDDLKRKTNVSDFETLRKSVQSMEEAVGSELDAINSTINGDRSKMEGEIAANKQAADCRVSSCDREIERINQSVASLEYKFKESQSAERDRGDLRSTVKALQRDIERIHKSKAQKEVNSMGATGSGSCFSCGQRVTSFPALPPRIRSPDKTNIGGGFTFEAENDRPKANSNSNFSQQMQAELANIAKEIEPQNQQKKHSKYSVDRKPHKLPALNKSGSSTLL